MPRSPRWPRYGVRRSDTPRLRRYRTRPPAASVHPLVAPRRARRTPGSRASEGKAGAYRRTRARVLYTRPRGGPRTPTRVSHLSFTPIFSTNPNLLVPLFTCIKNVLSFKPPSETRDSHHPYTGEMGVPPAPTCPDNCTRLRAPKTATHSGGHHARRGCEGKIGVLGGGTNEGGRAGSCGGEMLRGEFEPTPSPRRSSRGG